MGLGNDPHNVTVLSINCFQQVGTGTDQIECSERQVVEPLDGFQLIVSQAEVVQASALPKAADLTDGIVCLVSTINQYVWTPQAYSTQIYWVVDYDSELFRLAFW